MSEGIIDGNILYISVQSITVDIPSTAAATSAETDFTVQGLEPGDFVFVNKPTLSAGVGIVNARVKAANTLSLTVMNATAGAVDPASETYLLCIIRKAGK